MESNSLDKSVWQFRNLTYKDNEQTFRCEAQNNCTLHKNEVKSSNNTTLNVFYSPRVTVDKSGPITKREGQNLEKIDCTADSNPPNSTITWTSDSDKPWKGGLPLEIAVLDRGQNGTYTCKATVTSSLGTLTGTSQIEIIVNYAPDVEVTSQTTSEGHKLTVTCEAFGRPDSYTFHGFQQSWRDQFVRKVEGTKEERNKYVWTVQSASYKDSGTYQCLVDNTIKDTNNTLIQSNTTLVVVNGKPVITLESKRDETVGEETSTQVRLYKTVFSQSEITSHKWMKNSDVINDTRIKTEMTKTQITLSLFENVVVHDGGYNFTLDINMFEESDTGQYRLEVCNNFTCDIFSTHLTAAGPPYMPRSFSAFGSTTDTVFLKWTADFAGGPYTQRFLVEYRDTDTKSDWIQQWYNEHAERDEVVFMNITGLNSGHTYVFRVLAENSRNLRNRSPFTSELSLETIVKSSSSANTGVVIGGVAGSVVALIVIAVIVTVIVTCRRKQHKKHGKDSEKGLMSNGSNGSEEMDPNPIYESSDQADPHILRNEEMDPNPIYESSAGASSQILKNEDDLENLYSKVKKSNEAKTDKSAEKNKLKVEFKAADNSKEKKKEKAKLKEETKKEKNLKAEKKNKKGNKGGVYENVELQNVYSNSAFDDNVYQNDKKKSDTTAHTEGVIYVDLDFSGYTPSRQVLGDDNEKTEYACIDHGKVGEPLPDDEQNN